MSKAILARMQNGQEPIYNNTTMKTFLRLLLVTVCCIVINKIFAYDVKIDGIYYDCSHNAGIISVTYKDLYKGTPEYYGNIELSFSKIVDVVNYYASSKEVTNLFKVKLMKMMWYADCLSYKMFGHSITGLPYIALPMGAVPESHDYIIKLDGIDYEIEIIDGNESYHFISRKKSFPFLNDEEKSVLDKVISIMGKWKTERIVSHMHEEVAYIKTKKNHAISFEYAKELSIDN